MSTKDRPVMDWRNAIALALCFVVAIFSVMVIDQLRSAIFPLVASTIGIFWLGWPIWKYLLF